MTDLYTTTDAALCTKALAEALDLALTGRAVFPCILKPKARGTGYDKKPTTPNGFHDATKNAAEIEELWRRHPGPLVGYATGKPSGVIVIDVDTYKHPEAAQWIAENGAIFEGVHSYKTRSGGRHFLFRYPSDLDSAAYPEGIRCSTDFPVAGIDVRGDGGYAIYWPAQGCEVIAGSFEEPPAALLEAVKKPIQVHPDRHASDGPKRFNDASTDAKNAVLAECLRCIPNSDAKNDSRDRWRDIAFSVRDAFELGADRAKELFLEWSEKGAGYDDGTEAELERIWDSRRDSGPVRGIGSLILEAQANGGAAEIHRIYGEDEVARKQIFPPLIEDLGEYIPRYRMVHDIQPDMTPQLWDGLIRRGTTCVLYAPPFVGKTILAAALAFSVAQGRPCMGRDCEQGAVYFAEAEGADLLADNLRAVYNANGIDIESAPVCISDEYLNLTDAASVRATIRDIEHFAARNGGCRLIIVDTLSQSIAGQDENAQGVMSEAVKQIALMGRQIGAATLVIHHCGKNEEAGMRGSSVLAANTHAVIELANQGSGLVKMTAKKFKGGKPALPEFFRIEERTLRTDHKGRPVTAGVAVHVLAADAKAAETEVKLTPPQKAVMAALSGAWPGGEIMKAELQHRFNLHYVSTSDKPNSRNKAMNRALNELAARGLISLKADGDSFCLAQSPHRLTEATEIFGPMQ